MKKNEDFESKLSFSITLFTVICIGLVLWINHMATYENGNKYEGLGEIGDTIGGLTAPIIGLISALLVYVSFREQRIANEIQIKALEEEKIRARSDRWFQLQIQRYHIWEKKFENLEIILYNETKEGKVNIFDPKTSYSGTTSLNIFIFFLNARKIGDFKPYQNYILETYFLLLLSVLRDLVVIIEELQAKENIFPEEVKSLRKMCGRHFLLSNSNLNRIKVNLKEDEAKVFNAFLKTVSYIQTI